MIIPNLIIIAGTGTKSGKTTLACRIIEQFRTMGITAIKISPHLHDTTPGLIARSEEKGYSVHEETDSTNGKDTSRMLKAGASRVFFASAWDHPLPEVFLSIMEKIPEGAPVICESPSLRNYVEPGLLLIMTSDVTENPRDIDDLIALPHMLIRLEDLRNTPILPFMFSEGKWGSLITG